MRIVYITDPSLFETSFCLIKELNRKVDVELIIILSSGAWLNRAYSKSFEFKKSFITSDPSVVESFLGKEYSNYLKNVKIHILYSAFRKSFSPNNWLIGVKFARYINLLNPDIIHINEGNQILAYGLSFLRKRKVIVDIHDPFFHSGQKLDIRRIILRFIWGRRANAFILHNETQEKGFSELRYAVNKDICVIPFRNCDILMEWCKKELPEEEVILFYGQISPYKGLEYFIKSINELIKIHKSIKAIIAGRISWGPPFSYYKSLVEFDDSFEFIQGYVDNYLSAELFQRAKIVVLPYTDATQSGVLMTALAFKKVVIATNTGGMPEYIKHRHNGILVPPKDPQKLTEAMDELLTSSDLFQQIKTNLEHEGEINPWEETANITKLFYRKILKLTKLIKHVKYIL